MQQRTGGFTISGTESLQIISQNIDTLGQLQTASQTEKDVQHTPLRHVQAFDFDTRQVKIGQWLDVKDTIDQWVRSCNSS